MLVLALTGGDEDGGAGDDGRASSGGVSLKFPRAWEQVPRAELRRAGTNAVAGVRRRDGAAVLVVRAEPRRRQPLDQIADDLRAELERRFRDFRFVGRRTIETAAGPAFYFSYVRRRAGTAHSVTLAPVGERNYSLTTVVRGGSEAAAREVGAIIRSFGPSGD